MKAARTMSETLCLKVSLSCMVFWLLLRRVVIDALSVVQGGVRVLDLFLCGGFKSPESWLLSCRVPAA
jgi:hypothetical protein